MKPHPLGVGHDGAGLQTEQDVVSLGVVPAGVVRIVGGDQRYPGPPREGNKSLVDLRLLGQPVVLYLEEVVLAEKPLVVSRRVLSAGDVALQQPTGDLTTETARERDQSLGVLRQQLFIDPRAVVITLEVSTAG